MVGSFVCVGAAHEGVLCSDGSLGCGVVSMVMGPGAVRSGMVTSGCIEWFCLMSMRDVRAVMLVLVVLRCSTVF